MLDILPIFSKLFKASQSDSLDDKFGVLLALTRGSLTAMGAEADGTANLKALLDLPLADGRFEYHGVHLKRCDTHVAAIHNQKSQFLKELLAQQLERRFPQDGMALLQSLHKLFHLHKIKAFDAQDVTTYGKRELESVLLSPLLPFFFPSYYILLPASNFQHCLIIYFTPYH